MAESARGEIIFGETAHAIVAGIQPTHYLRIISGIPAFGRRGSTLRSRAGCHVVPQLDSHHRPPAPATPYALAAAQALTGQEREVSRRSTRDWEKRCTTCSCCSRPLGTTKRSARSRWWCAFSPNLCTQPPRTTSLHDLHTQPPHTTSTRIHCAHPPRTSTAHIHRAYPPRPPAAGLSLNLLTRSPRTISTHDLHT
ncbi:hypothetical protein B0H14DRAFT_3143233 [Mycena olivaceomarginata]|nr:hypothetical protein B0H14DRAFT_3143233 [Mycena olivaceomarginata]